MAAKKKNSSAENSGMSPLWEAIFLLDAKQVLKICSKGADINETIDQGPMEKISPLMVAAEHFDLEAVKKMVELGADVNAKTTGDNVATPLKSAIMGGSLEKVRLLVESGADVNPFADRETNFSPLALAAVRDYEDIFDYLLSKGADPHWRDHKNSTILKIVVNNEESWEQVKIAQKLIELGVSPNEPDEEGFFPIHNASAEGNDPGIEVLIAAGASVDQPITGVGDDAGHRPLRKAATSGHVETFKLLLSKGADINSLIPKKQSFQIVDIEGEDVSEPFMSEGLDLLSAVLSHGYQETGGIAIGSEREELISILCNAGFSPNMFTLAFVLLFDGGEGCKKLLFETAKHDLEKHLSPTTIAPFMHFIIFIVKQNNANHRLLEITEELYGFLKDINIDSDICISIKSLLEKVREEVDEHYEEGTFEEYDEDSGVYILYYEVPDADDYIDEPYELEELSRVENLEEIIKRFFAEGRFLGCFSNAYPDVDRIDFTGPGGEEFADFEDLMNADPNILPDPLKGIWKVAISENKVILTWKVPNWFLADSDYEGWQLFDAAPLEQMLSEYVYGLD